MEVLAVLGVLVLIVIIVACLACVCFAVVLYLPLFICLALAIIATVYENYNLAVILIIAGAILSYYWLRNNGWAYQIKYRYKVWEKNHPIPAYLYWVIVTAMVVVILYILR